MAKLASHRSFKPNVLGSNPSGGIARFGEIIAEEQARFLRLPHKQESMGSTPISAI